MLFLFLFRLHLDFFPILRGSSLTGDLKAAFDVFSAKTDSVPRGEVGNVLRAVKLNPSEAQVTNLIGDCCPNAFNTDKVSFADMDKIHKKATTLLGGVKWDAELLKAFQAFDPKKTGKVDVAALKKALGCIGEKLSSAQLDDMIKDAGGGSSIDYTKFISFLVSH